MPHRTNQPRLSSPTSYPPAGDANLILAVLGKRTPRNILPIGDISPVQPTRWLDGSRYAKPYL